MAVGKNHTVVGAFVGIVALVVAWAAVVSFLKTKCRDPEKLSKLFFAKEWHHALAINLLRLHGDEEENILHSVSSGNYTVK